MPPGWSRPKAKKHICPHCQENVFSSSLHSKLLGALSELSGSVSLEYRCSSQDLYESVLGGCSWCSILARGIITAAHLDFWMEQWNASNSDGSSPEDHSDVDFQVASEAGEIPNTNQALGEDDGSETEESEDSKDVEDELSLTLSDLNNGRGELSVQLRFLREDGSQKFTSLESVTGLTWLAGDDSGNYDAKNVEDVRMVFEVFMGPGALLGSGGGYYLC